MSTDSAVSIFIIGLGLGLITALANIIQIYITGLMADRRQTNDWKRQDDVIARADERADVLAERLLESNKQIARSAAKTSGELITRVDEIHTLVNDRLTKALNGQLLALEGQLAVLMEITTPTQSTLLHIGDTQKQIAALREELKVRTAQQGQLDAKRVGGI
jgi:hypothetical protein